MPKKAKNLAIISALLLTVGMTNVSCSLGVDTYDAAPNPLRVQEESPYKISVDVASGIEVEVPDSAKAGEIVNVTLAYGENVVVHALLVNGNAAARVDETHFYFEMPSAEVVLTLDADISGLYGLVSLSDPDVEVYGWTNFNPGDTVDFQLGLKPGSAYTIADVEVGILNEEGTEIETPIEYDYAGGVYSFLAPETLENDVGILAEVENKMFSIVVDEEDDNIMSIYETKEGEETETTITSKEHAFSGSTIRVTLRDTDAALAKGVEILETGEQILISEDSSSTTKEVTFTMPSRDITLKAIVEDNVLPVQVVIEGEHTTATLYRLEEDAEGNEELVALETNEAIPGERVYFRYETSDPDFKVTEVRGTYMTSYGSQYNLSIQYDEGLQAYYFTMMNSDNVVLTLTETEKQDITLTQKEGYALSTYLEDEEGNYVETTGGFVGDRVYVKVESETDPAYIYVRYVDENGESQVEVLDEEGGYYYFDMELGTDFVVDITLENQFADYPFVGDYVGANLYGSRMDYSMGDSFSLTGSTFVKKTYSTTEYGILYVDGESTDTSGTIFLENGIVAYGDGFLFTSYYIDSLTDTDNYIMAKPIEGKEMHARGRLVNTATSSSYGVGLYQIYAIDTTTQEEEIVASFLIDFEEGKQYMDDVEFLSEGSFQEAESVEVQMGGQTIGTIESNVYTRAE